MKRLLPFLVLLLVCVCSSAKKNPVAHQVVSLVPSVTETIYALGAEDYLVGVTTFCDYPKAAQAKPKVGDFSNPSLERIIALKPELVFATLPEQKPVVERLRELGVKVFISQPASIDDVLSEIKIIGAVLGREPRADSVIAAMKVRLDSVSMIVGSDTPAVYVEISASPLMGVGKGSFLNDVIHRAGGRNIFSDIDQAYPIISAEQVLRRDPDVIVILHPLAGKRDVARRMGWSKIEAVKNGRVYDDLSEDLLLRPGPRVVEGIFELALRLHTH